MTDRVFALTVVLKDDTRVDDVQALVNVISMLRGVLRVDKHVADLTLYTAYTRAKQDLSTRLWRMLADAPPSP